MSDLQISVSDGITISEAMSFTKDSQYLLISRKNECARLLQKRKDMTPDDRTDFLIALHIVLETGINGLLRQIFIRFNHLMDAAQKSEAEQEFDSVNFREKVTSFIYLSKFTFATPEERKLANEHRSIIGKMRRFTEIRNKLLHGHAISETSHYENGTSKHWRSTMIKKLGDESTITSQIQMFTDIVSGIRFYVEHLEGTITPSGKHDLCQSFIDDAFLIPAEK